MSATGSAAALPEMHKWWQKGEPTKAAFVMPWLLCSAPIYLRKYFPVSESSGFAPAYVAGVKAQHI